jgi:hypothetical protein
MSVDTLLPVIDTRWVETPKGQGLLDEESLQVGRVLDSIFGDQFLQIGHWGGDSFLRFVRTQRAAVLCEWPNNGIASAVVAPGDLAIADDSIDVVLLPHVLETNQDPHSVLREVDRIMRPDGHVVVLGFNPYSVWGATHALSRRHFPAGIRQMISAHRLRDWFRLLNFSVLETSFFFFHSPILSRPVAHHHREDPGGRESFLSGSVRILRNCGRKIVPLAGCYVLVARKELFTVTPIRRAWKRRTQLVGGLVNPTTRNAA